MDEYAWGVVYAFKGFGKEDGYNLIAVSRTHMSRGIEVIESGSLVVAEDGRKTTHPNGEKWLLFESKEEANKVAFESTRIYKSHAPFHVVKLRKCDEFPKWHMAEEIYGAVTIDF